MTGLIALAIMTYVGGAAWQDIRLRRIHNAWNGYWGLGFILLHVWAGTWMASLIGLGVMGMATLIPAIRGWWGVGDWKMAMVLGAAVGVLPALLIWLIGCMMAGWLQKWFHALSLRYMDEAMASKIPLAAAMAMSAVGVVIIGFMV